MISELAAQSTIPICWSLSGLRLLRLEPNGFALLPPTAEFENQPSLPVNIFPFSVLTIVKNSFSEFSILFPRHFNFTLLGNYIWLLNFFLVNPSCTAIDQYCHSWSGMKPNLISLQLCPESGSIDSVLMVFKACRYLLYILHLMAYNSVAITVFLFFFFLPFHLLIVFHVRIGVSFTGERSLNRVDNVPG